MCEFMLRVRRHFLLESLQPDRLSDSPATALPGGGLAPLCCHAAPPQPEEPRRPREQQARAAQGAHGAPGRACAGGKLVQLHHLRLPGEHGADPGALAGVADAGGVLIQSASKAAKQLRSQMTPPAGDVA